MKYKLIVNLLRATLNAAFLLMAMAGITACHPIFEDTEECCEMKCQLFLQLHFETEEPLHERMVVSRGSDVDISSYFNPEIEQKRDISDDGTDLNHLTDVKRFIIHAYPLDDNGEIHSGEYEYFIVDATTYGFSDYVLQQILLSYKPYRIYVWADYGDAMLGDLYYNTSEFGAISLYGDYSGSNYNRITYVGTTDVDLSMDVVDGTSAKAYVEMTSPMARFLFITTDLEDFAAEMAERKQQHRASSDETDEDSFDPNNYLLRIRYAGYVPSVYDMFYGRPTDASVGLSFYSRITPLGTNTALLGFDYIFVNGSTSAVDVIIDVFEIGDDGTVGDYLGSTPQITISLETGHFTAIYGLFLTTTNTGSIGIDPGFDNEIYIHWD